MGISKNLADSIRRYKLERDLSVAELAEELHLAVSTTQEYLNGNCNPRADGDACGNADLRSAVRNGAGGKHGPDCEGPGRLAAG